MGTPTNREVHAAELLLKRFHPFLSTETLPFFETVVAGKDCHFSRIEQMSQGERIQGIWDPSPFNREGKTDHFWGLGRDGRLRQLDVFWSMSTGFRCGVETQVWEFQNGLWDLLARISYSRFSDVLKGALDGWVDKADKRLRTLESSRAYLEALEINITLNRR
ncbi:MAG: hypothetical protein K8Q91_00040 [Candidatus Vogelbacteria bacterium]|nr:hypothetical protein [Candidatus Vogelbacteria bacterium]